MESELSRKQKLNSRKQKLNWLTPQVETHKLKSGLYLPLQTKNFLNNIQNRNPRKIHKSKYDLIDHLCHNKCIYFIFIYYKYLYLFPLSEYSQRANASGVFHHHQQGEAFGVQESVLV